MGLIRRYLFPMVVGLLLVVGVSYASTTAPSNADEVVLAQAEDEGDGDEAMRHRGGSGHYGPRAFLRHAVRAEAVVEGPEGEFRTIRTDRGELSAIEDRMLVIEEADGEVVRIPVGEATEIQRDGEEAELGDLQERDHVFAHRVDDGDGFVTEHVFALSPEGYEEREANRAERFERRRLGRDDAAAA